LQDVQRHIQYDTGNLQEKDGLWPESRAVKRNAAGKSKNRLQAAEYDKIGLFRIFTEFFLKVTRRCRYGVSD